MTDTTKTPTKIDIAALAASSLDGLSNTTYAQEQHAKGVKLAGDGFTLAIAVNGVWSASKPGTFVSSYEKLGYHAHATEILRGFLEAGGKCVFYGFHGIEGEVTL